jgi:hypothetical protein
MAKKNDLTYIASTGAGGEKYEIRRYWLARKDR